MADAPLGAQACAAGNHLGHQFVGMQAALHQRLGVVAADQRHGHGRGFMTVLDVHDPVLSEVEAIFLGDGANPLLGSDQDRVDQVRLGGEQGAPERFTIAGVNYRHVDRCQAFGALDQHLQACVFVGYGDFRHGRALGADLFPRRQHFGAARHHQQLILIEAGAVEDDVVVVIELLFDGDRYGDGVADGHRPRKVHGRFDQDRSRPRELRSQGGRHQRCGPHAVRDEILEQAAVAEFGIGQCRIHVAGHQGEKSDILRAQCADQ
ncbi:MAG: hypothetical protein AW09_000165 [Candidatus Accumulibacter phosphatis]|uniref:Uncharacterized protein n=1 Tax=Candidatus Accumulibacter phosphatis TaxID=327160 RepID=A0A080M2H7_9PROT|nr:MAG: hypothetical protein AW09_000165 [Candidatus Accumulibacter phosphatis]